MKPTRANLFRERVHMLKLRQNSLEELKPSERPVEEVEAVSAEIRALQEQIAAPDPHWCDDYTDEEVAVLWEKILGLGKRNNDESHRLH